MSRLRVAVVRGSMLSPWETQNFRSLEGPFEVVAVGTRLHSFDLAGLGLPVRLLPGLGALPVPGFLRFLRRWLGRDFIWGLERRLEGCHIVHSMDTAAGYSYQAARFCRRRGARLVLTVFENIPFVHEEIPRLRRQKDFVRAATDRFLAVTEGAARTLELEGVEPARIVRLVPGLDLDHFHPAAPTNSRGLPIPAEAFRILWAGRLVPEKGLAQLVQAVAWLNRRAEAHLILAGQGPFRASLERLAARLGIGNRVHFAGRVPYAELPGLFTACHCFAFPSLPTPTWLEQWGMALTEAMACGLPVVGSDCGSIPEVIGGEGLLVPPADPFALAEALGRLHDDPGLRSDLGRRARARAEQAFDARKMARILARVYLELGGLSGAADPRPGCVPGPAG
jgi:glycosyltransferase involved in cell wall biosynthesis